MLGLLTSMPSINTLTWLALLPRMKTDVCPPGPPVCTTSTPGTVLSASGTVRNCSRSISAAVMTLTELPSSLASVGTVVALTTIGGNVSGTSCACAACV